MSLPNIVQTLHMKIPASTKKLWSLEEPGTKLEDSKGPFLADLWRDPTWSTGQGHGPGEGACSSEHAVSQPIMVQQRRSGSYPGSGDQGGTSMFSPRSSETSGLGVKVVEYVLGSSPTIKDLDVGRMHHVGGGRMHHHQHQAKSDPDKVKKGKEGKLKDADGRTAVMQANGIMHNSIDDDKVDNSVVVYRGGSRQASPSDDSNVDKMSDAPLEALVMGPGGAGVGGRPLEAHFEHHPMDPLGPFDYPRHGLLPTSMESPGIQDYTQIFTAIEQQKGYKPLQKESVWVLLH
ncbi:pumilio homolog 2-like [Haemaphysalis longicornis]